MRAFLHRIAWLTGLLFAVAAHADPQVPPTLEPWRGWVLHGQEFRACPLIAGHSGTAPEDFLCAWPGLLSLNADAGGASVTQHWRVEAESWIPLPGDTAHWPQQVTVDGQPAPVVQHDGPSLRLAAGTHEIRARIPWRERPQTLHVPAVIGLVALTVDGKTVAPVQRKDGEVTLGRGAAAAPEVDNVVLQVYRKLTDGVPAMLTTEIRWSVSGQAREETVGPVLPAGFEPMRIDSEQWPARLDADGRLHVQVQPGWSTLRVEARAIAPLTKVVARVPEAPWPKQEIWSYEAAPTLRVTSAASALQVDPRQADVDQEWAALPAFALGDGAELTIDERSRGLAADDKNRLTLDREMWLDFSGDGWFARDRVGGEMLRGWRFDVAQPMTLERADALNAVFRQRKGESLLVTHGVEPGLTGVEWRTPLVDLGAGVRIASASSVLPVTGWQDSFERVNTTLHLPSGYKLLGAPGADSAAGSWVSGWTLLDVFIAAIVVLLAWRLFGIVGAVIAAAYLVLSYQETGAPLWTLLVALALGLIARLLPGGKLAIAATWTRRAALALLVLVALPFVADQLRYALHPQLENRANTYTATLAGGLVSLKRVALSPAEEGRTEVAESPPPAAPAPQPEMNSAEDKSKLETETVAGANIRRVDVETANPVITVAASNTRRADIIDHYNESTVVQTGAGEPGWNLGSNYVLTWSGPVLPSQSVRLVIAPPWLVRLLRVGMVALLALLIVRLVRGNLGTVARTSAASLAGAMLLSAVSIPSPVRAQAFPPENLLNELRAHAIETPVCVPNCASIANADVSARGDEIRIALEAHAAARVALPVPAGDDSLQLRSVAVDGAVQDGIANNKGVMQVGLARGVHRVELLYASAADKVALKFPLQPMRVAFSGEGWQSSGVNDDRLMTETLSLSRARENGTAGPAGTQRFSPFVLVSRDITLGLNWTLSTDVRRLAPSTGGFTVSVPALAGEHVSTAGIKNDGGSIIAAIGDNDSDVAWGSTLDKSDTITLTAPPLSDRAEIWRVTASPIWHVESSGVPMTADSDADKSDYHSFQFHPLPGETLTLRISKPQAADGSTRAIDRASLVMSAGQRASDSVLDLTMRASQGGEQSIALPADAEVMNVTRNNEVLNLRPRDGKLSLPVVPGAQRFQIRFREPLAAASITRSPTVALGLPAANIDLGIDLPADRWLLATSGPAQGPAVLYWSELIVMLIVAWVLARTRRTPLTLRQWILLGIGFSTFSWLALLPVAAWLFALDWRARSASPTSNTLFNLAQIGLAILTVFALLCLAAAIPQGLLGTPDMHVTGNRSSAQALRWFADRSDDALPAASAISVPLWVYKVAMLAWATWLANAVVGWLGYGFKAWMRDGYWRAAPRKPAIEIPVAPPPPSRS